MINKKVATSSTGRERILKSAARLFGELGYDRTSIRKISLESGMKAGSIYYFFKSKDELLLEVQARGFELMSKYVAEATTNVTDPWERLYRACEAHLNGMFDNRTFIEVTVRELPDRHPGPSRRAMIRLRSKYEALFVRIIEDLPLNGSVDHSDFRLTLLGSMAWTLVWYDPAGRHTPHEMARKMVDLLRYQSSAE
tara:strand:- start:1088 stop:1675 length:588 start_codon:yes stop_codon:yes gene_type:complete